jgi:hypothetical protein
LDFLFYNSYSASAVSIAIYYFLRAYLAAIDSLANLVAIFSSAYLAAINSLPNLAASES